MKIENSVIYENGKAMHKYRMTYRLKPKMNLIVTILYEVFSKIIKICTEYRKTFRAKGQAY